MSASKEHNEHVHREPIHSESIQEVQTINTDIRANNAESNRASSLNSTYEVKIYTDGACRGNPGPGGWGALLEYGSSRKMLHGGEKTTTNNRMELTAVIRGLQALKRSCKVQVVSDSKYVLQGITEWLPNWKQRGWRTAAKKPVLNSDLWQELDALVQQHDIDWAWVRGHSGHPENELADQLANRGIDEMI